MPRQGGARQADGRVPLSADVGAAFIDRSRRYLTEDYLPRLQGTLGRMSYDDIWYRPNQASNSAGNLVLHLCGNARQWIVSGVGGEPDVRRRQEEFDQRGPVARERLTTLLDDTFADLDRVLRATTSASLLERRTIQGNDVTVLEAILHVVEHVSHHTGQILWIAKARTGKDLGFWTIEGGVATPTWKK